MKISVTIFRMNKKERWSFFENMQKHLEAKSRTHIRSSTSSFLLSLLLLTVITLFVKSWRIFKHLLCSLPEGNKPYRVSFHNHGDLCRIWINSLTLEKKQKKDRSRTKKPVRSFCKKTLFNSINKPTSRTRKDETLDMSFPFIKESTLYWTNRDEP